MVDQESVQLAVHGGEPVRRTPWPTYDKGAVFVEPEDEAAALRAVRSHLFFRYDSRPLQDTECGALEQELCGYFGSRHALAVSSGTAALALAIMAAQIPPGSLIACPGFTFVATPSAVVLAGCTPFLVEVDENLNLDLADLRRRWNPDIKAILVVHMRGFASDAPALVEFAAEMGVPLFEDAVPALGAELNGRKLGTFGLAGAFSTQSDKSLNCGEGGFLVTDDSTLFARAAVLSGAYEGRLRRHFPDGTPPLLASDLDLPLLSFRMDEIRGALLRSELSRLPIRLHRFRRTTTTSPTHCAICRESQLRQPIADGAYLGEAFIFRVPGGNAQWFAQRTAPRGHRRPQSGLHQRHQRTRLLELAVPLRYRAGRADPGAAAPDHAVPVRGGGHSAVLNAHRAGLRPPHHGGTPGGGRGQLRRARRRTVATPMTTTPTTTTLPRLSLVGMFGGLFAGYPG